MKRLLPLIAIVLLGSCAVPGVPQEPEDGLLEEPIVRSGERVPAEEDIYGNAAEMLADTSDRVTRLSKQVEGPIQSPTQILIADRNSEFD